MFIDTHAHLGDSKFSNLDETINEFTVAGVSKVIAIGCSFKEIETLKKVIKDHTNIYTAFGIYPLKNIEESNGHSDEELMKHLVESINNQHVLAIGECGIDLTTPPPWEISRELKDQIRLFEKQIELAKSKDLPFIVHSRNSTREVLEVLKKYKGSVKFVWHCFTEDTPVAKQVLDIGGKLSFTGIITYKNTSNIPEVIKYVGIENLMIETDAPYLTPEPARSQGIKINTPLYVKITANKIAEILNLSIDEVESKTTENAVKFFKIPL